MTAAAAAQAVRQLAQVLPKGAVSTAEADRLGCSMDLWPRHILRLWQGKTASLPLAVVWPASLDELQAVAAFSYRHGLPLVPYGGGSSVVGGATPHEEQVVVDTKRLMRVVSVDSEARMATAQAGITGELFERSLERVGLTQGHFPSSIYTSTLGGWIAARGAGQMSSRYGKIEDQVLGGAVVLGDGTLVRQSPTSMRTALFDELLGSEGSLGLWGEATVRVQPVPAAQLWRGFSFASVGAALKAAQGWLLAGLSPAVVRIYDPFDSLLHRNTHGKEPPHDRGPSRLAWVGAHWPRLASSIADVLAKSCRTIVGLQGDPLALEDEYKVLLDVARAHGGFDLGAGPGEAWYEKRYAVSYRQSNALRAGVAVDTMEVACSWERVEDVYRAVRRAGLRARAQVLAHFSHIYLDGASIYFTYAFPAKGGESAYDRLWQECLAAALAHGGNVSHHHGVGQLKSAALARALGGATALLRARKLRFDPGGTLNPNVLPLSSEASSAVPELWPDARSLLCTATASETVHELEERIGRDGLTLGPVAQLFARVPVLALARAGWLWRYSPQLRVLEPVLIGADGEVEGKVHRCVPAPRGALGPDLVAAMVQAGSVSRLWLRCLPRPRCHDAWQGPWRELLARARQAVRDESHGGVDVMLSVGHPATMLQLRCFGDMAHLRRKHWCAQWGEPSAAVEEASLPGPGDEGPLIFTAPWSQIEELLTTSLGPEVACTLPWIDAAGVAGFLHPPAGHPWGEGVRERLRERLEASPLLTYQAPPLAPSSVSAPATDFEQPSFEPHGARVALSGMRGQLDNCTYCPKLCRFSCPVSTAGANEALTPRQLMLTLSLARRGARALTPDVARRLYACVDCRGCKSFCDHDNDVAAVLAESRTELFAAEQAPSDVRQLLVELRARGHLPDFAGAGHPRARLGGDAGAQAALFLGCQNEAQDEGPCAAALQLARARYGAVRLVGDTVPCCGHPLWRWGDREGFAKHAQRFSQQLRDVSTLIVDDPGCAYALRELYPRVGVVVPEVLTATSLLDPEARVSGVPAPVPHDSCFSTRYLDEAPLRERLGPAAVSGSVLEGEAGCCGGMLLPYYDAGLAREVAEAQVDDLLGGGGRTIVAASPTCRRRLRCTGAAVADLLESSSAPRAETASLSSEGGDLSRGGGRG